MDRSDAARRSGRATSPARHLGLEADPRDAQRPSRNEQDRPCRFVRERRPNGGTTARAHRTQLRRFRTRRRRLPHQRRRSRRSERFQRSAPQDREETRQRPQAGQARRRQPARPRQDAGRRWLGPRRRTPPAQLPRSCLPAFPDARRRRRPDGGGRRRLHGRQAAAGSLGDPGPPPQRQDRLGGRRADGQSWPDRRQGSLAGRDEPLYPAGGDRHRGPALLRPLGRRSDRHHPRLHAEHGGRRDRAGRLDPDPAARQERLPQSRPDHPPQDPGSDPGFVAGAEIHQGPDPRDVSEPGLFRLRFDRRRGSVPALFRQAGRRGESRRGGAAGGPPEGAVAAVAGQRSGRRQGAGRGGAGGDETRASSARPNMPTPRRRSRPMPRATGRAASITPPIW